MIETKTRSTYPKMEKMLEAFAINYSDVLLVHSAFKGFGLDGYEPQKVLQTLINYMKSGTLLLPTMSWRYVKPEKPYFDELETPSNTGILTEIFRQNFAEQRSLHPTHSVASRGEHTAEIVGEHHLTETPCGPTSPFGKLLKLNGKIIMLGVGFDCCSLIHHVEELYAESYYVKPESETEYYECRNRFGAMSQVKLRRHLFLPRNYWQFQDALAAQGKLKIFRCDNSICLSFSAKDLFEVVAKAIQENPAVIIAKPGQRYRLM